RPRMVSMPGPIRDARTTAPESVSVACTSRPSSAAPASGARYAKQPLAAAHNAATSSPFTNVILSNAKDLLSSSTGALVVPVAIRRERERVVGDIARIRLRLGLAVEQAARDHRL